MTMTMSLGMFKGSTFWLFSITLLLEKICCCWYSGFECGVCTCSCGNQQKCVFFTAANECDTPPVVPEIGSEWRVREVYQPFIGPCQTCCLLFKSIEIDIHQNIQNCTTFLKHPSWYWTKKKNSNCSFGAFLCVSIIFCSPVQWRTKFTRQTILYWHSGFGLYSSDYYRQLWKRKQASVVFQFWLSPSDYHFRTMISSLQSWNSHSEKTANQISIILYICLWSSPPICQIIMCIFNAFAFKHQECFGDVKVRSFELRRTKRKGHIKACLL